MKRASGNCAAKDCIINDRLLVMQLYKLRPRSMRSASDFLDSNFDPSNAAESRENQCDSKT